MRSAGFIIKTKFSSGKVKGAHNWSPILFISLLLCIFTVSVEAQIVAVLEPNAEPVSDLVPKLKGDLSAHLDTLDPSLVEAAFKASKHSDPYNMTSEEAKITGSAIGCDFLLLIKTGNLRRTSFERPEYYESFAAIYVVSSRTGRLAYWTIRNAEQRTQAEANTKLLALIPAMALDLAATIKGAHKLEIVEHRPLNIAEPPLPGTPDAKGFIAPIPYRRIKPEYSETAYLYNVTATVEILVDLDAAGSVTRTEIVRWAGFGLDESVQKAVRTMNWRPAERDKRTLPMRVLLRYNFKKAEAKP
ncbi:MAG: energy transducer TonB [Pyrinomonadaceae bacterium]|nr:energy transducer TonB [Acidobacteriota bacterium]MBK7934447.1 energy transducer TonB [Acidobacteriota bacterium]MBP7377246.1 energy transducer TonB [Pyrinomonadaceae bacterium]